MSNTIPLKEKLDFQQYQLVINALTKIGIEIDIPTNVDAYAASLKEKELKETPLKENEQLFKIELPLAEPLFLADKKGGEMIVITKDTYNKLLIRIEELETLNRTLKEKLVERPVASVAPVAPVAPAPTQAPTPPPAMAFTSTPVAHIPEPQATPVTQSPMAFTSTPVATPPPVATSPKESTHTFSTTEPLATSPLVPHTITKTTEEPTYHKEPTPTYQTPMSTSLHQDAANISNEEALERARRIIEKYKK